jgi:hypothetical protein
VHFGVSSLGSGLPAANHKISRVAIQMEGSRVSRDVTRHLAKTIQTTGALALARLLPSKILAIIR